MASLYIEVFMLPKEAQVFLIDHNQLDETSLSQIVLPFSTLTTQQQLRFTVHVSVLHPSLLKRGKKIHS